MPSSQSTIASANRGGPAASGISASGTSSTSICMSTVALSCSASAALQLLGIGGRLHGADAQDGAVVALAFGMLDDDLEAAELGEARS